MKQDAPPEIIKLLAHDLRWQLMKILAIGDYRVNELVTQLEQPLNLVSYHLKQLREAGLVAMRRSDADGRDNYYSADLDHLRTAFTQAGTAIHPALVGRDTGNLSGERPVQVLFVCTHNSARSQIAEGLMRHLGGDGVRVSSAGSEPATVHPDAIRVMDDLDIDIRSQQSKGFDALRDKSFDVVITVCDQAREVCPTFPGEGQQIHWGLSDPAAIADADERQQAFRWTAQRLQSRIRHFLTTLKKD